tara:strand:+ start:248 stop:367 length:120 start_codon:yes stop_codon:yes gene_type:complete
MVIARILSKAEKVTMGNGFRIFPTIHYYENYISLLVPEE